jgi:hypothetical protein
MIILTIKLPACRPIGNYLETGLWESDGHFLEADFWTAPRWEVATGDVDSEELPCPRF